MHGLNAHSGDYTKNIEIIKRAYPGIYVTSLKVFDGLESGITHMDKQLEAVAKAVQSDPMLQNGFNFYGQSQGALLARAYVTVYNDPPVYNLVGMNGPQSGVGECPTIELPYLKEMCGELGTSIAIYSWPACSFCSYWKGPKSKDSYLEKSQWLADVNNERQINPKYQENMKKLNAYMATYAERDEVVQPPQSAWHTYWPWGETNRSTIVPLEDTEGYKNDALGLKTLNERGAVILNSFDGGHCHYEWEWWNKTVLPMFNNTLP